MKDKYLFLEIVDCWCVIVSLEVFTYVFILIWITIDSIFIFLCHVKTIQLYDNQQQ